MDACKLGFDLDLGNCAKQLLLGWVPDWLWTVISWWPWIVGIIGGLIALGALVKVKQLAGWPGVFAVVTLGAYALGRFHGRPSFEPIENFRDDEPDAVTPKRRARRPKGIPAGSIATPND